MFKIICVRSLELNGDRDRSSDSSSISRSNHKHFMTGHEGKKMYTFPRDQSLSDLLYRCIDGNFEAGNSSTAVIGQHSRVTLHCYPLTL